MTRTELTIILAALVLTGCPAAQGTPTAAPTAPAKPASLQAKFPRPDAAKTTGPLDSSCTKPLARLEAGLALEADVWAVVVCDTARMAPDAVDDYLARVEKYLAQVPSQHVDFPKEKLSQALLDEGNYSAEERASLPSKMRVFADAAAVGRHPELRTIQHLGSGGYRGVCAPWSKAGHYQVTAQSLNKVKDQQIYFSPDAVAIVSDASQDPDLFAWNSMAAHGQTKSNAQGLPDETPDVAQQAWIDFVKKEFELVKASCQSDARLALYHVGFGLHAIQDVASHRGRTNPEHAYNAKSETNPDEQDPSVALATDMSIRFLGAALAKPELAPCKQKFKEFKGGPIGFVEKVTRLSYVLQFTPGAVSAYRDSAALFAPHASPKDAPNPARVRWFGSTADGPATCEDANCKALLARLVQAL